MRLLVRSGADTGREVTVDHEMTIGRSAANDVTLPESDISNYHARVRPVPGGIEVTDTGSRNGTFVNGQRLEATPVIVRPGEELKLANTVLAVEDEAAVPSATEAPPGDAEAPEEPAVPRSLVVRTGPDTDRTLLLEPGRDYTIGRDPSSDLVLTDPRVSSRHARVRLENDQIVVDDLGSANGTLLNGDVVSGTARAGDGAELQAGETVLVFYASQRTGAFEPTPTIIGTVGAAAASSVAAAAAKRSGSRPKLPMVLVGLVAIVALGAAIAAILLTAGGDDDDDRASREPTANRELSIPEIIDRLRPSVIQIITVIDPVTGSAALGSGSVIDDREGLILTNNHVATGGELLILNEEIGDETFEAELVAAAPCEDLALIRVTDRDVIRQLKAVRFGKASDLRQGQQVVALGFPASAESGSGARLDTLSATSGIISKAATTYDNPGDVPHLEEAIQHQAAVNPGNSGGPLFDLRGRQIGVNTAIFFIEGRGRAEGENYAISVSRLDRLIPDLREGISPKWLGTAFEILVSRSTGEPLGLGIVGITPGSPGDRAGLVAGADIIVEVDGEEVTDMHSYCQAMPEGEDVEVELTVLDRDTGRTREVTVDGIGRFDGSK